jgi:hypothetical protein
MPRAKTANDVQVSIKLPAAVVAQADELAGRLAPPGAVLTRTDVLRAAIIRGISAIALDVEKRR